MTIDETELFLRCQLKNVDVFILNKFKLILNQNGCWESFIGSIPKSFSKLISEWQIREKVRLSNQAVTAGSPAITPADVILNELRKRNARVSDVIPWLENASVGLDQALMLFKPNEPLEIIQEPPQIYNAETQIKLLCKAKGFPTPKYQWYKDDQELLTEIFSELNISNINQNNEGVYRCKVYNIDRLSNESTNSLLSRECCVIVKNNGCNGASINKLRIIRHPVSPARKTAQGASVVLICEAESPNPTIFYQWYKNRKQMVGETNSELRLSDIRPQKGISKWTYYCFVSDGKTTEISKEAKICLNIPNLETQFYAKRKLALLFGNKEYQQLENTELTISDVITLSDILKSKGFEIFAYQNLTLTEMKNAVEMFIKLVEDDDYVVFYFAGHGFEECNLHYMIPVEASKDYLPADSMSVQSVLQKLQINTPALILMLIDMCRNNPERTKPSSVTSNETKITVNESNVLIAYATSPNMSACETSGQLNGDFVHYLKQFLNQKLDIVDILDRVKGEMSLKQQSPWTSGNLSKKLSLDDPCLSKDDDQFHSELYRMKVAFGNDLRDKVLKFKEFECVISLQLYRHKNTFLNGIDFVLKIPNYNKIGSITVNLNTKSNPSIKLIPNDCQFDDCKSFTIMNIQKLQDDLIVIIDLISKVKNVSRERKLVNLGIDKSLARRIM